MLLKQKLKALAATIAADSNIRQRMPGGGDESY